MKKIATLISILILYSCQQKEEGNLTILNLNNNLKAYCIDDECSKDALYLNENYANFFKKSNNIVRFKIINNTSNNYFLKISNINNPLFEEQSFPNILYGLDLKNLQIINDSTKEVIKSYSMLNQEVNITKDKDSTLLKMYNKLGYINNNDWITINKNLSKRIILIPSKQSIFFETAVNLPFNRPYRSVSQGILLNKKNKYSAQVILYSDTTNIKKYLTWSQLKNIEENNYKLFHGTITSENSVPIVFCRLTSMLC